MIRTLLLTSGALVAFAANSLLARMALGAHTIDPSTYAAIRFGSGAVLLLVLAAAAPRREPLLTGDWSAAAWLFAYAVPFSFAYVSLGTGTGALILFGAVQTTMLAAALASGERIRPTRWVGLALAVAGLVYLVWPGLGGPSVSGSLLMGLAGMAWGVYSLRGRHARAPLTATARNFLYVLPLLCGVALAALAAGAVRITAAGLSLAVLSGGVASGLGYVLWYGALRRLSASRAAIVQLLVPVLASLGGVLVLDEAVTWRLVLSSGLILGGVGLALQARTSPVEGTTV
jgi:drug/metabolite transporter (DMT)-like permease